MITARNGFDKELWQARFDSTMSMLDIQIDLTSNATIPRSQTICTTLRHLKAFGKAQFDFFIESIDKGRLQTLDQICKNSGSDEDSLPFPNIGYHTPEMIMHITLNQIARDMSVLERAFMQRTGLRTQQRLEKIDKLSQLVADRLPFNSQLRTASPFVRFEPVLLTYFQKDTGVRILPYAPVALVGLPMSSLNTDIDLLAIPHEIAHFLYWHGVESIATSPDPAEASSDSSVAFYSSEFGPSSSCSSKDWQESKKWAEEVFCDVFSVVMAGPIAGWSMQQQEKTHVGEHFDHDRTPHPPAIVRPWIHGLACIEISKTLYPNEYEQSNLYLLGKQLNESWEVTVAGRSNASDPSDPQSRQSVGSGETQDEAFPGISRDFPTFGISESNASDLLATDLGSAHYGDIRPTGLTKAQIENLIQDAIRACQQSAEDKHDTREILRYLYELIRDVLDALPPDLLESQFESGEIQPIFPWQACSQTEDIMSGKMMGRQLATVYFEPLQGELREFEANSLSSDDDGDWWLDLAEERGIRPPASGLIAAETWLRLMRFAGWTTEGPNIKGHG